MMLEELAAERRRMARLGASMVVDNNDDDAQSFREFGRPAADGREP